MNWRVKLPDCELPRIDEAVMLPATGWRGAEVVRRLVLEEGADVAERGHADAEHVRALGLVDHLVEQVRIEAVLDADVDGQVSGRLASLMSIGVPGNGVVALQRAKDQSVDGITLPSVTCPFTVSLVCVVSTASVVSSDAGR